MIEEKIFLHEFWTLFPRYHSIKLGIKRIWFSILGLKSSQIKILNINVNINSVVVVCLLLVGDEHLLKIYLWQYWLNYEFSNGKSMDWWYFRRSYSVLMILSPVVEYNEKRSWVVYMLKKELKTVKRE